jgi:hypothetical protein
MLKFKQFISEAALQNPKFDPDKKITDKNGKQKGHFAQYIEPHIGKTHEDSPLQLDKDTEGRDHKGNKTGVVHPKGSKLSPSGRCIKVGTMHHAEVETEDGHVTHVPVNSIRKPSASLGTYSDEHAVKRVWNYSAKHPEHEGHVRKLHDEINEAENNPKHDLHISHADPSEFVGKEKDSDTAKKTYYDRLRAAAHLTHMMVHGQGGKKNGGPMAATHKAGVQMKVSGADTVPTSKHFQKHGVKKYGIAGTRKGDMLMLKGKSISLKHSGGSQLFSESPEGTRAMLHHAINEHQKKNKGTNRELTKEEEKSHRNTITDIHKHMRDENHKAAHQLFSKMRDHPKYNHKNGDNSIDISLGYEGGTGKTKFNRPHRPVKDERHPGVAHYMAYIPIRKGDHSKLKNPHGETKFAKITRRDIAAGLRNPDGSHQRPSIESGKGGPTNKTNPSSMRMATRGNNKQYKDVPIPEKDSY